MSSVTAPNAPSKTATSSSPPKLDADLAHRIAVMDAVADSALMRDAAKVLKATEELQSLVQQFLDDHDDGTSLVRAIKDAGIKKFDEQKFVDLATGITLDCEMLNFNLLAAISFVSSQIVGQNKPSRRSR